ncbi:MAG: formylglycine-generating enzyme family protein [Vulcanimicrobiota bacterium]
MPRRLRLVLRLVCRLVRREEFRPVAPPPSSVTKSPSVAPPASSSSKSSPAAPPSSSVTKSSSVAPPASSVLKSPSVAPPASKPPSASPAVPPASKRPVGVACRAPCISRPRLNPSTLIAVGISVLLIIALFLGYSASRQSTEPSVPPGQEPSATSEASTTPQQPVLQSPKDTLNVNPKDGAAMIIIPAGEFLMGSPEGTGSDDEHPQHRVYLDAYYIYKYEVTNGQFARFVKETRYKAVGNWKEYAKSGRERHPVVNITWNDAAAYCKWAGGSLPTEAQWEKAARGSNGRDYPWGNTWDGNCCNGGKGPKVSGMADISGGRGTAPVGSFPSGVSPYGVHDMAGNVWEWCSDWYDENYYRSSPSKNPEGPGSGSSRILRGGSWGNDGAGCFRCAYRYWDAPDDWYDYLGFRVCRPSITP